MIVPDCAGASSGFFAGSAAVAASVEAMRSVNAFRGRLGFMVWFSRFGLIGCGLKSFQRNRDDLRPCFLAFEMREPVITGVSHLIDPGGADDAGRADRVP